MNEKLLMLILEHTKDRVLKDIKVETDGEYIKRATVLLDDGGKLSFSFSSDQVRGCTMGWMLDVTYEKDGIESVYL